MKTTAEKIKVMQAYLDGRSILCTDVVTRSTTTFKMGRSVDPNWNWETCDYEIVPRTFWVVAYTDSSMNCVTSLATAEKLSKCYTNSEILEVKEVIK